MPDVPEFDNLFDRFEKGEVREAERVVRLDTDGDGTADGGSLDADKQNITIDRLINVAEVVNVQLGVVESDSPEDVELEPTFFDSFAVDSSAVGTDGTVVSAYGEPIDAEENDQDDNVVKVGFFELDSSDVDISEAGGTESITITSDSQYLNDESYHSDVDQYSINSDDITHIKVTARGY